MESESHTTFTHLSQIEIYKDEHKAFYGKSLLIDGKPYCGLAKYAHNPKTGQYTQIKDKCVYLPAEAWKTFVSDTVPALSASIEEHQPAQPSHNKRPVNNSTTSNQHSAEDSTKSTQASNTCTTSSTTTSIKFPPLKKKCTIGIL